MERIQYGLKPISQIGLIIGDGGYIVFHIFNPTGHALTTSFSKVRYSIIRLILYNVNLFESSILS